MSVNVNSYSMHKFSSPVKQTSNSSQASVTPRFTGSISGAGTAISTSEASAASQGIHLHAGPILGIAMGSFAVLLGLIVAVQCWRGRHDKKPSENGAVAPTGANTTIDHIV